ncbi:hypothetical protein D3C73_1607830 [compost metagenome]
MRTAQLRPDDFRSRLVRIEADARHQVEDGVERTVDLRLGDELSNTHMRAEAEAE